MDIKTVTVIGANGTMGRNVAGIFASFGNCKVYMVCRTLEKANNAKLQAILSVRADAIAANLIPCDYSNLEMCLGTSDLIFDSVVENMEAKLEINSLIEKYASDRTIICTGTSGLSITQLSEVFSEKNKAHYLGMHMYNPPYNMNLCEVIPTKYTDRKILKLVKTYADIVLNRTVVEVQDAPAFLGNRIGFQFINEAAQYAEKYKDNGGIDYIDAILGPYTGRNMAPLLTTDFVGLDVHKAIVDNIYANTSDFMHESFLMPNFINGLIKNNKLGKKTGAGLYRIRKQEDDSKVTEVFDIAENKFRRSVRYNFSFKNKIIEKLKTGDYSKAIKILLSNHSLEAEICVGFLLRYACYSIYLADALTEDIGSADEVMANGYNWIPPLGVIDAFGGKEYFISILKERLGTETWEKMDGDRIFYELPCSTYDYRKYLKARV